MKKLPGVFVKKINLVNCNPFTPSMVVVAQQIVVSRVCMNGVIEKRKKRGEAIQVE